MLERSVLKGSGGGSRTRRRSRRSGAAAAAAMGDVRRARSGGLPWEWSNGGWLGWADGWFHCVVGLLGSSSRPGREIVVRPGL